MRHGLGVVGLAVMMLAGPAAAQETGPTLESQMRLAFGACADVTASRAPVTHLRGLLAQAGFVHAEPDTDFGDTNTMQWLEPGRSLVSVSSSGPGRGCQILAVDSQQSTAEYDRLAHAAMTWAAEDIQGPWQHWRMMAGDVAHFRATGQDVYVDAFPSILQDVGGQNAQQRLHVWVSPGQPAPTTDPVEAMTLETPPHRPRPAAPEPPAVREVALATLRQCYVFNGEGPRGMRDWLLGAGFARNLNSGVWTWSDGRGVEEADILVEFSQGPGAEERACGLHVMTRPADVGLFDLGLEVMEENRRGFSRSREDTGLGCLMRVVTERTRDHVSTASCSRLAADDQPVIGFRVDSPSGF